MKEKSNKRNEEDRGPPRTTWPPSWLSFSVATASLPPTPAELPSSSAPAELPAPAKIDTPPPPWPPDLVVISQAEAAAIYPTGAEAPVVPPDYPPVRPAEPGPCCYSQHHCRWRSKSGVILCGICCPPAHPGVLAEWLDRDS